MCGALVSNWDACIHLGCVNVSPEDVGLGSPGIMSRVIARGTMPWMSDLLTLVTRQLRDTNRRFQRLRSIQVFSPLPSARLLCGHCKPHLLHDKSLLAINFTPAVKSL